jgi:hypothetical protein
MQLGLIINSVVMQVILQASCPGAVRSSAFGAVLTCDFQAFNFQERTIKALSIVRPSGGRIASGEKTLEVRRWHPDLDPSEDLLIVENQRFLHTDGDEDDGGIAVAIVRVKAVRPFVLADMQAACASYFEDGWLAWELIDIRPVTHPATIRAARGIYEVDFLPQTDADH